MLQVRAVPGLQVQLAGLVAERERIHLAAFELGLIATSSAFTLQGYSNGNG